MPDKKEDLGESLADWAKRTKKKVTRSCDTCKKHPELVRQIEEIVRMQLDGRTPISRKQLWQKLVDDMGYSLSNSALDRHVNYCVIPNLSPAKKGAK